MRYHICYGITDAISDEVDAQDPTPQHSMAMVFGSWGLRPPWVSMHRRKAYRGILNSVARWRALAAGSSWLPQLGMALRCHTRCGTTVTHP